MFLAVLVLVQIVDQIVVVLLVCTVDQIVVAQPAGHHFKLVQLAV